MGRGGREKQAGRELITGAAPPMPETNSTKQHRISDPVLDVLVKTVAAEVVELLKAEFGRVSNVDIKPALLTVKQAAVYLGRSEQAVQHLIFQKEIPVVRVGRRVHLDRRDLEVWIEKNKY